MSIIGRFVLTFLASATIALGSESLLVIGDSMSSPTAGTDWPARLPNFAPSVTSGGTTNLAVPSKTVITWMWPRYSTDAHPYRPSPGETKWLSLWGGVNDAYQYNCYEIYYYLKLYWAAALSDGFRVLAVAPPDNAFLSFLESPEYAFRIESFKTLRDLILSDPSLYTKSVNLYEFFNNTTDARYYTQVDQLHFIAPGNWEAARFIGNAVSSDLNSNPNARRMNSGRIISSGSNFSVSSLGATSIVCDPAGNSVTGTIPWASSMPGQTISIFHSGTSGTITLRTGCGNATLATMPAGTSRVLVSATSGWTVSGTDGQTATVTGLVNAWVAQHPSANATTIRSVITRILDIMGDDAIWDAYLMPAAFHSSTTSGTYRSLFSTYPMTASGSILPTLSTYGPTLSIRSQKLEISHPSTTDDGWFIAGTANDTGSYRTLVGAATSGSAGIVTMSWTIGASANVSIGYGNTSYITGRGADQNEWFSTAVSTSTSGTFRSAFWQNGASVGSGTTVTQIQNQASPVTRRIFANDTEATYGTLTFLLHTKVGITLRQYYLLRQMVRMYIRPLDQM